MEIRAAKPDDAGSIAAVHIAAWRMAYRGLMPDAYLDGLSVERRTVLWQKWLAQPGSGTVLVAADEDTLSGFCLYGPTRDADGKDKQVAEILAINIHPGFWRKGTGRALCERVFASATERNWVAITLWVLTQSAGARQFYDRLGFIPDGAERTDTELIGSPLHELRYRKETRMAQRPSDSVTELA